MRMTTRNKIWHRAALLGEAIIILGASAITGGCSEPPSAGDQAPEAVSSIQQPVYNGVPVAQPNNAGPTGVPQIMVGGGACSAVVYNQYWLITAAHCFSPTQDPQNDWVYWNTDIPNLAGADGFDANLNPHAHFLQTSAANSAGDIKILAGFRSPDINQDTALVLLDPASNGVYMPGLTGQSIRYSNGHLVIYSGTNASLVTNPRSTVLSYGWGPNTFTAPTWNGSLNKAYKTVFSADNLYYYTGLFNNAGNNCMGDSGGPDFRWDGGGFQLSGIHGTGDNPCNGAGSGSLRENGAQAFRTWVKNTAATVPMNSSVAPESATGQPASNGSDYNPGTTWSSLSFPSSSNDRGGAAIWFQTYLKMAGTVNRVNIRARCHSFGTSTPPSCVKSGFPVSYNIHVWNGAWNFSGTFTQQPDGFGIVSLPVPAVNNATAIRMTPNQLGKDTSGTYYFKLAELQPANDQ